jgi:hypothetical protein
MTLAQLARYAAIWVAFMAGSAIADEPGQAILYPYVSETIDHQTRHFAVESMEFKNFPDASGTSGRTSIRGVVVQFEDVYGLTNYSWIRQRLSQAGVPG